MYKKWIGEGLKDTGVNKNVLNILRTLVDDKDSTVYVPYDYIKGSNEYFRNYDSRVHFYPIESGRPAKILSVSSNSERYNFSIVCLIDVLVEYEGDNDSVDLIPKKLWRTYNIIRDGKLVISKLSARLSEDSFNDLRSAGLLYYNGIEVSENHKYVEDFVYSIKLDDIPLVSVNWAQPSRIGLCEMILKDMDISAKLRVLRKMKKSLYVEESISDRDKEIYTENVDYVKNDNYEKVSVDCIVYRIPKYKVEYTEEDFKDIEDINSEVSRLTSELNRTRFMYRSVIYAIESTKLKGSFDWSEEYLLPRSKDKMAQSTEVIIGDNKYTLERISYKKEI